MPKRAEPETPGQVLQRWRKAAGYRTQMALAKALDARGVMAVTDATVSNWENDKHPPTPDDRVRQLDKFLGADGEIMQAYNIKPAPVDVREAVKQLTDALVTLSGEMQTIRSNLQDVAQRLEAVEQRLPPER